MGGCKVLKVNFRYSFDKFFKIIENNICKTKFEVLDDKGSYYNRCFVADDGYYVLVIQ